jgi:hypothetical protein
MGGEAATHPTRQLIDHHEPGVVPVAGVAGARIAEAHD